MAVKTLQARLQCEPETLKALWRTHDVFNERLKETLSLLFKMRRGECGKSPEERELYREISHFITGCPANNAPYLLNSVCIKNWVPTTAKKIKAMVSGPDGELVEVTGEGWADRAGRLSTEGTLLFDKRAFFGGLPPAMKQMIVREAVAYLRGYVSLVRRWQIQHQQWLDEKSAWEAVPEHRLYLALRPCFAAFETSVGGSLTRRRHRWDRYLTWLKQSPELTAWRGGPAVIYPVSEEGEKRIARGPRSRKSQLESEEFFKANPELKALDALHGFYERTFVRRRKTKRHMDGFDHKPTFTQPDAVIHPHWYIFSGPRTRPSGYRKLVLPKKSGQTGSIELSLITAEKNGCHETAWVQLRFRGDRRMRDIRPAVTVRQLNCGEKKGQMREISGYEVYDRTLKVWHPVEVKGARLMFDMKGKQPRAVYLSFVLKTKSISFSEAARGIRWTETGEVSESGKIRKRKLLPAGLITCAAHLGVRHFAYVTLAVGDGDTAHILRQRNLWLEREENAGRHMGRLQRGPSLAHIASHRQELTEKRSQMGRIPRGEAAHSKLRGHIANMAKDRYQQQARRIIDFAFNVESDIDPKTKEPYPTADVLIIENMNNLVPNAERERGVNQMLVASNRTRLVKHLKEVAANVGLRVFEISPFGTSQVCSRCGALGRPYSVGSKGKDGRVAITFSPAGQLFACPSCNYRASAAHNASANLHNRFYADRTIESFIDYVKQPLERRREILREIESQLISPTIGTLSLCRMHGFESEEYALTSS